MLDITSGPSGESTMVLPSASNSPSGPAFEPAHGGPVAGGWPFLGGGGVAGLGNGPVSTRPDMQPLKPR